MRANERTRSARRLSSSQAVDTLCQRHLDGPVFVGVFYEVLQEERMSVGGCDDPVETFGGVRVAELGGQLRRDPAGVQRLQRAGVDDTNIPRDSEPTNVEPGEHRTGLFRRLQRENRQNPGRVQRMQELTQERQTVFVGPVKVVDRDHDPRTLAQVPNDHAKGDERASTCVRWRHEVGPMVNQTCERLVPEHRWEKPIQTPEVDRVEGAACPPAP